MDTIALPDLSVSKPISENEKIVLDTGKNQAQYEKISKRPVLHLFNFLHLNEPKKLWSIYAVLTYL